jgi:hypothetical protein
LLTVSRSFMNITNSVLWRMAIILKANKVNLFVSSVLFVFWYHSPNFLDTPSPLQAFASTKTFPMNYRLTCIHRLPLLSVPVTNVMQDSVFQLSNIRTVFTRSVPTKASTVAIKRAYVSTLTSGNTFWLKRSAATSSSFPQSNIMCLTEIPTNVYSTILFTRERWLDCQKNTSIRPVYWATSSLSLTEEFSRTHVYTDLLSFA